MADESQRTLPWAPIRASMAAPAGWLAAALLGVPWTVALPIALGVAILTDLPEWLARMQLFLTFREQERLKRTALMRRRKRTVDA